MDDVDRDTVRGAGFSDGEIIEIVPRPGPEHSRVGSIRPASGRIAHGLWWTSSVCAHSGRMPVVARSEAGRCAPLDSDRRTSMVS